MSAYKPVSESSPRRKILFDAVQYDNVGHYYLGYIAAIVKKEMAKNPCELFDLIVATGETRGVFSKPLLAEEALAEINRMAEWLESSKIAHSEQFRNAVTVTSPNSSDVGPI